jgi:ribosomal protein L12E/L44/L45/RPP1/RPP2
MALLTRDQVLAADDTKYATVAVPEWGAGGEIRLKSLSGFERDAFEQSVLVEAADGESKKVDLSNVRAKLVAASAVDELGQRLFTEADVEALGKKNGAALERVNAAAQKLSKLRKKDIDELLKNSAAPAAAQTPPAGADAGDGSTSV